MTVTVNLCLIRMYMVANFYRVSVYVAYQFQGHAHVMTTIAIAITAVELFNQLYGVCITPRHATSD